MSRPQESIFCIVVFGVEVTLKADNQTACFCIEAAQRGGMLQNEAGIGELGENGIFQCLSRLFREAVGYTQDIAVFKTALLDHFHQRLGCFLGTAGLVNGSHTTAQRNTGYPNAQHTGDLATAMETRPFLARFSMDSRQNRVWIWLW